MSHWRTMLLPSTEPLAPAPGPFRRWIGSDMRVLRWVFLGLYAAVLLGLALLGFGGDGAVAVLILAATFFGGQAIFVFGGGTMQLCRPIRKRRLLMPVFVAATMLTLLLAGAFLATTELFDLDRVFGDDLWAIAFFATVGVSWAGWGVLLWAHVKRRSRYSAIGRLAGAIFGGSLVELLATVPSHVIVSRRPGCLVGLGTMLGIIAGCYAMLFSFGPMIVLLFLRPRHRREGADPVQFCFNCGYDLRTSIERCPECGTPIPARQWLATA